MSDSVENYILNRTKFLNMIKQGTIDPPDSMTLVDCLLFYYIGHMAVTKNHGKLLQIGVGGNTAPLLELSETHQVELAVIDIDQDRLSKYSNHDHFPRAIVKNNAMNCINLCQLYLENLLYCDIYGNPDYEIVLSSLKYCAENLGVNGLIYQDDFGNHRKRIVADAVYEMMYSGQLKMLVVGDRGAWLTRPEYYDYWMQIFATDSEFLAFSEYANLIPSEKVHKHPNYLSLKLWSENEKLPMASDSLIDYYNHLLSYKNPKFVSLQYLPNRYQPGLPFIKHYVYAVSLVWDQIKGIDWPQSAPETKQDIDNLPTWIKDELKNLLNFSDLYSTEICMKNTCQYRIDPWLYQ